MRATGITATFYYSQEESTPDITNEKNADSANKIAHKNKPFASVWILPSGQVNLIENP